METPDGMTIEEFEGLPKKHPLKVKVAKEWEDFYRIKPIPDIPVFNKRGR